MVLNALDWMIIAAYFILSLLIGFAASNKSGKSTSEFFLSGRSMPWWLLGVSMVATTFSTDTPNLVTDMVRQNGVAGNWAWWAFLLTGMLTVFVYAKLWRRSHVMTDLEFYELRYSGKAAAFLRGFRALYLGAFFNVMVIATTSLALIKIGAVMLHWSAVKTMVVASFVTMAYSAIGGFTGVLLTDFFQFILAMTGSIGAAVIVLKMPKVGGLHNLLSHPAVVPKLNLLPDFSNRDALMTLLILPLVVQWWSVWYPGAEPGGGGYVAQRMLAAKSEKGAIGATLLFNVAHYALRPWPWILVALASMVVFPDLASLRAAFPNVDPSIIRHDFAYPAMLSMLPRGFIGLVVASLFAAYMSTASTHLNWGSSYIVNDFYRRFVRHEATEKEFVLVGRICTVFFMVCASIFALLLRNALQAFQILLQVGAGTGLIYILRWFWWRINAASEITAMIISFLVAVYFRFIHPAIGFTVPSAAAELVIGVGITTVLWLVVMFLTKATDVKKLRSFYKKVHPGGPGWKKIVREAVKTEKDFKKFTSEKSDIPTGIVSMVLGCIAVYSALFATGNWIYGKVPYAVGLTVLFMASSAGLMRAWTHLKVK
jgi:SSS family solute:Na+ symporter